MIEGSPYQKVISDRKAESADQRERRIADYKKERNRGRLMLEQLTQAFQFELEGNQKLRWLQRLRV